MKRFIVCLMALSMLLSCLGGAALAQEPYTHLDWFLTYSALPGEWNMNEPIFREITNATGVQCTMNIPAEDATTKLNLLMIDRNLPDLITTDNTDSVADLIEAGLVWDMGELMRTYVPDSHLFQDLPADVMAEYDRVMGGWYAFTSHVTADSLTDIYGYPTEEIADYYRGARYDNRHAIFFYKPYIDQLGIDLSKVNTEAELMETLAKIDAANLTTAEGAPVYTMMVNGTNSRYTSFENTLANTFGAMTVSDDGHYQNMNYSDEYRDAMEFLNRCAQLGYLTETQLVMDERSVVNICNSGRSACFIGALSTLNSGADVEKLWLSAGTIVSDRGAKPVMGYSSSVYAGWLYTMVAKDAENPEACAKFIDYMTSREGMLLHMYGIEGEDYYYDELGCVHRTEAGANKIEDKISGMWGFWGFHVNPFETSVKYTDVSFIKPTMVYGASDDVVIYDASLFELPVGYVDPASDEAFIITEVNNYIDATIPEMILAKDDATFNAMYDNFWQQLDDLGLREYDAYIDLAVQENCRLKGVTLTPVN